MSFILTMLLATGRAEPLDELDVLPSSPELPAEIVEAELSAPRLLPSQGLSARQEAIGDGGTAAEAIPSKGFSYPRRRTPAPPTCRPRVSPIILGALDKCVLDERIEQRRPHIRRCHEQALEESPGLNGKIVLKVVIGPDGAVRDVTVRSSAMSRDSPGLEACMLGVLSRTMFGPMPGGGMAIVLYPFLLWP